MDFTSFQQVAIVALGQAVVTLGALAGMFVYGRRLKAAADAERTRVENAALEDDTKSSGILREFAKKWDTQIEELRRERDELKDKITEQRQELAVQATSLRHLEQWKVSAQSEQEGNKTRIAEQTALIEQYREQIDRLIRNNHDLQAEIERVKQHWQETLMAADEMRNASQQLKAQLTSAQEANQHLRDELQAVSDELAAEKRNIQQLINDNDKLKKECKNHVRKITELETRLQDCLARPLPAAADSQPAGAGTGDGKSDSSGDERTGADNGSDIGDR